MSYEINFNKMPCIYWTDLMKIEWLQRFIILHSIIYYKLNDNIISDKQFDVICKQYLKMAQNLNQSLLKQSMYYYCMYDFDGNTGFDVIERLSKKDKKYLLTIARQVLKLNKGRK